MPTEWTDDGDSFSIEGPFWGARVWHDGDEEVWFWEAWSDGDDTLSIESDSTDGEEASKAKAMRKAEKWLTGLGIDMESF